VKAFSQGILKYLDDLPSPFQAYTQQDFALFLYTFPDRHFEIFHNFCPSVLTDIPEYKVIQQGRSIFWDVIEMVIVREAKVRTKMLNLNDAIPLCMCNKFYCKVPSYTTIEYQL